MTLQNWRLDPKNSTLLKQMLENPVMKNALAVCDNLTAAKTIGASSSFISNANNAHVLFGFDSGRASFIRDLEALAEIPEDIQEPSPSYQGEF